MFIFFIDENISVFIFQDLRKAFSSVDYNHHGLVHIKDIPTIFTYLDQNYKLFIIEGDELKRLIDQININS